MFRYDYGSERYEDRRLRIAALCGEQQSTEDLGDVPLWQHDVIVVTAGASRHSGSSSRKSHIPARLLTRICCRIVHCPRVCTCEEELGGADLCGCSLAHHPDRGSAPGNTQPSVVFAAYYQNLLQARGAYWQDNCLAVFDEAHHCTKKHPFNVLLQDYHVPLPAQDRPKVRYRVRVCCKHTDPRHAEGIPAKPYPQPGPRHNKNCMLHLARSAQRCSR